MKRQSLWVISFVVAALMAIGYYSEKHHEPARAFQVAQPSAIGNNAPLLSGTGSAASTYNCGVQDPVVSYYNGTSNQLSVCWQGAWVSGPKAYLSGATGTITGTLLAAGGSDTGTATVAGATAGMKCGAVTPTDGTAITAFWMGCSVTGSGANNVTVWISSPVIGTPPTKAYNFGVFP